MTTAEERLRVTADQVRAVKFRRPPRFHRGYDEEQVDQFLDCIADSLDRHESIPAAKIRDASFDKPAIGRRGYHEADVQALLRIIERTVAG